MGDIGEQLAELRGAVLARLDEGARRMDEMDRKLDAIRESQTGATAQLADHESRLHALERAQEGRSSFWSQGIIAALNAAWSGVLAILSLRHR